MLNSVEALCIGSESPSHEEGEEVQGWPKGLVMGALCCQRLQKPGSKGFNRCKERGALTSVRSDLEVWLWGISIEKAWDGNVPAPSGSNAEYMNETFGSRTLKDVKLWTDRTEKAKISSRQN